MKKMSPLPFPTPLRIFMVKICLAIVLVMIIPDSTASSGTVKLKFLKGVRRLNLSNHFDYYFSCSIVGRFIQWQYNEEPLNAFHSNNHIGDSIVIERVNYVYTASLLSSEPVENNSLAMDSLLIVSFSSETTPSNFTVTCRNGPQFDMEVAGSIDSVGDFSMPDNSSNLVLDYITSDKIVKNGKTHIFMCGAQHSLQLLQANGPPISFSSRDLVGYHRSPATTRYAVREQGIFIAKSPFQTTSVLIVADESDVYVNCFFGSHLARVLSQPKVLTDTSPTTGIDQLITDVGISTTMGTNADSPQEMTTIPESQVTFFASPNNIDSNTALIVVAIGVVLVIFIVLGILLVIVKFFVKRSTSKLYSSEDSPSLFYNKPNVVILKHSSKINSIQTTQVRCEEKNSVEFEFCAVDPVQKDMMGPVLREPAKRVHTEVSGLIQREPGSPKQGVLSTLEQVRVSIPEQEGSNTLVSIPEQKESNTLELEETSTLKMRGPQSPGPKVVQKELSSLVQKESGSPVQTDMKALVEQDEHHSVQGDFRNPVQSNFQQEIMPQQNVPRYFKKNKQEVHTDGIFSVGDEQTQVLEPGAQFAMLAFGKLKKTVYIESDGQTFAHPDRIISADNLLSHSTVRHRKGAQNKEGSVPCSPSPFHFLAGYSLEAIDDH